MTKRARNELLELIGAGADRILAVGYIRAVLVVDGFTGHDETVEEIFGQRRCGFFSREPYGVVVNGSSAGDGSDVLLLFALGVGADAVERVDDIGRGHRRSEEHTSELQS